MDQSINIFEEAFNQSLIPSWITDANGFLIKANSSFYHFFGIFQEVDFKEFNFFLDLNCPVQIYQDIKKGKSVSFDLMIDFDSLSRKYDSKINGRIHSYFEISPIINQMNINGFIIHIIPNTDKYLEKLMNKRILFFFKTIFNKMPIGIAAFSPEGIMIEVNHYLEKIFELPRNYMIHSSLSKNFFFANQETTEEFYKILLVDKKNIMNFKLHTKKKTGWTFI